MAFVVLGALSAALLSVGSSEVQIAGNHLHGTKAQYLAEAGLEHAFNTLRTTPSYMTSANATLQSIIATTQLGGAGSYTVQYQAAGANTVRVVSTGISAVGGAQVIRRALMNASFTSNKAILTNGPLNITGNAEVEGQCGNVHTNNVLNVSGNADIDAAATAVTYNPPSGNATVGPGSGPAAAQFVPHIDSAAFLAAAQASLPASSVYQMKANGDVLRGDGTLIQHLNSGGSYCYWTYTSGTPASWALSGNDKCDGTFYFEGNANLSGNHGSEATPWVTTLITIGSLTVTGNQTVRPSLTDTMYIAGLDVSVSGNTTMLGGGLIAAHEQVSITGNSKINGFIIAEDASMTSGAVVTDAEAGNAEITYSCGLNPPLQGPLQFLSWGL